LAKTDFSNPPLWRPLALQTQPPRPLLPMGIVRISVRPDFVSRATDEFRELNFLMLTVGHAKSASGAPARCLHQFSRLDIFTMRRGVLTPALPENIGDGYPAVPSTRVLEYPSTRCH
jgi:hypothetical protein